MEGFSQILHFCLVQLASWLASYLYSFYIATLCVKYGWVSELFELVLGSDKHIERAYGMDGEWMVRVMGWMGKWTN